MRIDLTREQPVIISRAGMLFNPPVHRNTVGGYVRDGVRGVKLETFQQGGRRYTTRAAVRRFLEAQQEPASA